MSTKKEEQSLNPIAETKDHTLFSKRSVMQVYDTIIFEIQRNIRRTLIILAVIVAFFALNYYIAYNNEQQTDFEYYPTAAGYIQHFMGIMSLLLLVIGVAFGASILVVDFEQETGNILFPKITRGRLMLGRYIGNYFLIFGEILIYYLLVLLATLFKYNEIPGKFWHSFGWALFYGLMVFCMCGFFSAFLKRPSSVVVTVLLIMLIGLSIIQGILSVVSSIEPVFLPNYYANIIQFSLNMPAERRNIQEVPNSDLKVTNWLTPNSETAALGLVFYSMFFIISGYILYRRRQL